MILIIKEVIFEKRGKNDTNVLIYNYNLDINCRLKNKRTNLGKIYFENRKIIVISNTNANVTWFKKKNGTNCGILNY